MSKEETKGPASPTKRSFDVVASIIKESKEQVEPVARGGGAGGGVGVLKSFATPVRVRKENRGSITNSTSETGAAGDAGVGEEKLPISPSGGLFHVRLPSSLPLLTLHLFGRELTAVASFASFFAAHSR